MPQRQKKILPCIASPPPTSTRTRKEVETEKSALSEKKSASRTLFLSAFKILDCAWNLQLSQVLNFSVQNSCVAWVTGPTILPALCAGKDTVVTSAQLNKFSENYQQVQLLLVKNEKMTT